MVPEYTNVLQRYSLSSTRGNAKVHYEFLFFPAAA
jgi:hypothetical protein